MKNETIKYLKSAIVSCLGGPAGDPEACNFEAAAKIAHALMNEGHKVEEDTLNELQHNQYDCDFLEIEKQ